MLHNLCRGPKWSISVLKKKEAADWTVNRIFLNKTSVEEILIRMIKQYEKTE